MIIVDFIDMHNKEDIQRVSQRLKECIARDRVTTALVGMTELGLMQLTRKKTRLPLHKMIMRDCPVCGGTGLTENEFYAIDRIINDLIAAFSQTIYRSAVVKGSTAVAAALKRSRPRLKELERQFAAAISFEEISTGKLYYYEIEYKK
jgi:ribonuclease G